MNFPIGSLVVRSRCIAFLVLVCWSRRTSNAWPHELKLNGIGFSLEHPLPVEYKGLHLDCGYRIDVLVENEIILELKSVEEIKGIHQAQLLTYLRLSGVKQGFLINFNVERLVDGLRIFVL